MLNLHKHKDAAVFLGLCALILFLSIRGLPGNPNEQDINTEAWKQDGPFELSPDRGRFALLYSVMENHSLTFSIPLARFAAPDVAQSPFGGYTSLFAPGLSFLLIPGYVIGKWMGVSQVGTSAVIAFFAMLNAWLIRWVVARLGGSVWAGSVAGLAFLFATPAYAYAVSLYQHHLSTLIVLASVFLLLRFKSWWLVAGVWFLYALGIVVDNPNAFLLFPVVVWALAQSVEIRQSHAYAEMRFRASHIASVLAIIFPLAFFGWFNSSANGSAWRLSGTLPQVRAMDVAGNLQDSAVSGEAASLANEDIKRPENQNAVSFFQSRNLLEGFYTHLISPDRGVLWYAPVILMGIWGLAILYGFNVTLANVLAGIVSINVVLYSLWGDPYGGWAFGSRYLIPGYAMLAIGLGLVLHSFRKNTAFLILFACVFVYSAWVNTLGAVTSSMNPPKVEVLDLERLTGREQKYTYARNWQYLREKGSKSFFFRTYAQRGMSAVQYQAFLTLLICAGTGSYLYLLYRYSATEKSSSVSDKLNAETLKLRNQTL